MPQYKAELKHGKDRAQVDCEAPSDKAARKSLDRSIGNYTACGWKLEGIWKKLEEPRPT